MFSWRCCLVLILVWACEFVLWLVSFTDDACEAGLFWFRGLLVGLLVGCCFGNCFIGFLLVLTSG